VLSTVALLLMIYAIYSILTSDFEVSNKKLTFLIEVVLLPILGPIVYLTKRKTIIKAKQTK
jgi:hypothetical protein